MCEMHYEQENDMLNNVLSDVHSLHKIQTSGMKRRSNLVTNTPMTKDFSTSLKAPLKTSVNTSSRKAFGNVSNVLTSKQSIATKVELKSDSVLRESHKSVKDLKRGLKSNEMKSIECEAESASKESSKLMDDIESMFPNEEELMSEARDPITANLFAIDERTVFQMQFDSDMTECLVRPKSSKINFDDLF